MLLAVVLIKSTVNTVEYGAGGGGAVGYSVTTAQCAGWAGLVRGQVWENFIYTITRQLWSRSS